MWQTVSVNLKSSKEISPPPRPTPPKTTNGIMVSYLQNIKNYDIGTFLQIVYVHRHRGIQTANNILIDVFNCK